MSNLYGLWDWVGMAPRMGPESRSSTFPLGRPVSRKAGKKQTWEGDPSTQDKFSPNERGLSDG